MSSRIKLDTDTRGITLNNVSLRYSEHDGEPYIFICERMSESKTQKVREWLRRYNEGRVRFLDTDANT